jgi:hypothetical protein
MLRKPLLFDVQVSAHGWWNIACLVQKRNPSIAVFFQRSFTRQKQTQLNIPSKEELLCVAVFSGWQAY